MNYSKIRKKPIGVLVFPGTQCDQDVIQALKGLNYPVRKMWYTEFFAPKDYSAFILPGGFSYGDYLRAGALAGHSPAMRDIHKAAKQGWPILGICNGFQILCEAGLLEGVLRINKSLRFIDDWVELELCHSCRVWGGDEMAKVVCIPIAHKEGSFYIDSDGVKKLEDRGQIWWRYRNNPNGSVGNIAGIMNEKKNVAGLMPHPERAMAEWMGSSDGALFFNFL